MKKPLITLRNNTWYIRCRVPKRYASVEDRTMLHLSLHTDSKSIAEGKWRAIWDNHVEAWEAKLAGDTADAEKRHAAAVELAKVRGFRYLPTREVLNLGTEEVLARVEASRDKEEAAALLGTVGRPKITVTKALEMYWDLAKDKTLRKSEDQVRPRVTGLILFRLNGILRTNLLTCPFSTRRIAVRKKRLLLGAGA